MKKLIVVLLVVCLIFGGIIGYISYRNDALPETEPSPAAQTAEPETSPSAEPTAEPISIETVDYDTLYALYPADEVVMHINGTDVTWDEYFYMMFSQAQQVTDYFETMANYYGMAMSWEDMVEQGGSQSYADYVTETADSSIIQFAAIEAFAEENDVQLTQENLDDIAAQLEDDIIAVCGEGATEEDFYEYLTNIYMTRDLYNRVNRLNYLYQQNYIQIYGADGELLGDEAAMEYLEDNEYISANHILFMTIDSSTGQALDQAVIDEKLASAQALAEELQAITDPEELVARFEELKAEYCEDTGKTSYPSGYVFTPGTMVAEFEDTCNSLEEYQVSDPIESSYGYHIILRLPLNADAVVEYTSSGNPMTGRSLAANAQYGSRLQSLMDGLSIEYAEGFEQINILDYLH